MSKTERMIQPSKDRDDKRKTYVMQMARYKQAMANAFYLEAMMIDYAMMEDRLLSMLYHMAVLNERAPKVAKGTRKEHVKAIVREYKAQGESDVLSVLSISGKMKIIRCVLQWTASSEEKPTDPYLRALRKQCESVDILAVLDVFAQMTEWCKYRNEIVHALLNKNMDSVDDEILRYAEEGMQIARILDAQARIIKKGNLIRKAVKLKTE